MNNNVRGNMTGKMNLNVNVNDLETLRCSRCGSMHGNKAFVLKFLPALMSPNGRNTILEAPMGYSCFKCGSLNTFTTAEQRNEAREKGILVFPPADENREIDPGTGLYKEEIDNVRSDDGTS